MVTRSVTYTALAALAVALACHESAHSVVAAPVAPSAPASLPTSPPPVSMARSGFGGARAFAYDATADLLYGVDDATGALLARRGTDASPLAVGVVPIPVVGLAFRDADRLLYAATPAGDGLVSIDPADASVVDVLPVEGAAPLEALAFRGDRLFGLDRVAGALVELDPDVGTRVAVRPMDPALDLVALGSHPRNGHLFGIDAAGSRVVGLEPSNGLAWTVAGLPTSDFSGLASDGSAFHMLSPAGEEVLVVDRTGRIGFAEVGGLAWGGEGKLRGVDSVSATVLAIDLGDLRAEAVAQIDSADLAGRRAAAGDASVVDPATGDAFRVDAASSSLVVVRAASSEDAPPVAVGFDLPRSLLFAADLSTGAVVRGTSDAPPSLAVATVAALATRGPASPPVDGLRAVAAASGRLAPASTDRAASVAVAKSAPAGPASRLVAISFGVGTARRFRVEHRTTWDATPNLTFTY